ncbi:hypothetical protein [Rathayibacter tanaceti]|uniref:Uncharacterized protein n=2 Tax=Rathayibacter tanaceti TaxID=1671680 RepID=A0A166H8Z4_9MICO|nr:hypothetical protein [Rathayibacter tanaceti]KZX20165.1 hypothetical protein ACH61_02728 [Rathayibacter tanaceti]QHC56424.1 hypothetical protein GSU10_12795 [Rathayibacter tanaceti]TCO36616.1 hypothetical protein EV639_10618 [Rathayibacter tanaceti]
MSDREQAETAARRRRRIWLMLPIMFVGVLAGRGVAIAVGAEDPWNVVVNAAVSAVVAAAALVLLDRPR